MVEPIRSYHARRGRLSPNAVAALETLSPELDLAYAPEPLDFDTIFGRVAPRALEIGSGLGDAALQLAAENPDTDYIAADVHTKGIARTMLAIRDRGVPNLRVLHGDALRFITDRVPPGSLNAVLVFFPDPWPKARHNKRRLVRPAFAEAVVAALEPGGTLHLATDITEYAEVMRVVLGREAELQLLHDGPRVLERPRTKYELAGERHGRHAIDLVYRRGA